MSSPHHCMHPGEGRYNTLLGPVTQLTGRTCLWSSFSTLNCPVIASFILFVVNGRSLNQKMISFSLLILCNL